MDIRSFCALTKSREGSAFSSFCGCPTLSEGWVLRTAAFRPQLVAQGARDRCEGAGHNKRSRGALGRFAFGSIRCHSEPAVGRSSREGHGHQPLGFPRGPERQSNGEPSRGNNVCARLSRSAREESLLPLLLGCHSERSVPTLYFRKSSSRFPSGREVEESLFGLCGWKIVVEKRNICFSLFRVPLLGGQSFSSDIIQVRYWALAPGTGIPACAPGPRCHHEVAPQAKASCFRRSKKSTDESAFLRLCGCPTFLP